MRAVNKQTSFPRRSKARLLSLYSEWADGLLRPRLQVLRKDGSSGGKADVHFESKGNKE